MRIATLIILLFIACASADRTTTVPVVYDNENIFSPAEEKELADLIISHERKTTNEIAIVTTPDMGEYERMVDFAVGFGETLGVGKSEKDNGVIIAFSKAQREVFIATGYGAEKVLTDEIAKQIIDSVMLPQFKEERHFEGVLDGLKEVVDFLERPENEIK